MSQRTSSDPVIIEALRAGIITADPETGHVYRNGCPEPGKANGQGYRITSIGSRTCSQHRIVWISTNGPIPGGLEINHRNGQRDDNRLLNLELVTHSENVRQARRGMAAIHVRPADEAVADPTWLARVRELALTGATREQIARLRDDIQGGDDDRLRNPWASPHDGIARGKPSRNRRRRA